MLDYHYIIITPARNEADYLPGTIQSVVSQTIRPARWILVDDGSTDGTGRFLDEAAAQHPWIWVLHRENRGVRKAGAGVMEAFYSGLQRLNGEAWEYLVKLDGDVTFKPDYFERCFAHFMAEPLLGIGGGLVCRPEHGGTLPEAKGDPMVHVRGATKIYRYECWQAIGGLGRATGWDTVDELKANMLGWNTRTFPDIPIVHHRPAGGAYGAWANWVKNGQADYATGYHPVFMLLKCVRRLFMPPYGLAAAALWVGFCRGYFQRLPRIEDAQFVKYLRREQMKRLFCRSHLWR
jgi:glycosyltransferase involved in cell wall biosynthesis